MKIAEKIKRKIKANNVFGIAENHDYGHKHFCSSSNRSTNIFRVCNILKWKKKKRLSHLVILSSACAAFHISIDPMLHKQKKNGTSKLSVVELKNCMRI